MEEEGHGEKGWQKRNLAKVVLNSTGFYRVDDLLTTGPVPSKDFHRTGHISPPKQSMLLSLTAVSTSAKE
jgi:hypothetical protein